MKRVLIISELFFPQNEIGALRPTKLREYLIQNGYHVDVITKSASSKKDFDEHGKVWRMDTQHDNQYEKNKNTDNQRREIKFVLELKRVKRTVLSIRKGLTYCGRVIEFIKKNEIKIDDYDVVITTFGPVSSILIGLKLKRLFPSMNWICDFRDPMVVEEVSVFLKPIMGLLQRVSCEKAEYIVAVSNGYLRRICGNKYVSKRYMIPNGYDVNDMLVTKSFYPSSDVLHITYVGSLYEGKRKITPLFRAIRELADNGVVDLKMICFDYAGKDANYIYAQAEDYNIESIICDHGRLTREECLKLQFSSHLLVLSTWNKKGEEGVFPGKFLEYMLIGRPIISLTDGNMPNGEVTSVMKEGRFGVAYESICDKEDYAFLKEYVKNSYNELKNNGSITFEPHKEVLERYNYNRIIEKFEVLINE